MRHCRHLLILGLIVTFGAVAAGGQNVRSVDIDTTDRELLIRLAPEPVAPSPETLVASIRAHRPSADVLAAGSPVSARFVITDRARPEDRAALLAEPDRPRARLERWVVLTYPQEIDLDAIEQALRADPRVEVVERNKRGSFSAVAPNDTHFSLQWGAPSLELPDAWERTKGHGFVGLIDTGLDVDHPDLAMTFDPVEFKGGNFRPHLSNDFARPTTCSTNPGGCVDENEPGDPTNFTVHGHGTHVSGIVGATANNGSGVTGNCWHCSILMARSTLSTAQVANALRWLADHGAQAVSMSFGWSTVQSVIADAIDDVNERDLILVAAVGNDLEDIEFPAFDPDVIAAGGTEEPVAPGVVDFWERDVCPSALGGLPDCFGGTVNYSGNTECGSNYTVTSGSPMIELVAPAAEVLSTFYVGGCWNDGLGCYDGGFLPAGYDYCTGTSMSSPNVASVATLVRSVNPLLSEADVRDILKTTASGGGVWDSQLGYGVPDTAAAVDQILGTVASQVLPNRLTPLFNFWSSDAETHLSTTVPQRATAAIFDSEVSFISLGQGDPVSGYPGFPGEPRCIVGPCLYKPAAWVYLFTTDQEPFSGSPELVPLYRMSFDEDFGGNPLNRSFAYTTETVGVKQFADVGYQLDGIEGYIYKRCTPEPSCIPAGASRLYRMYHVARDDYVIFPESKLAQFQADGYIFQSGLNDWIGYVYENVDSDGDDVIDGFETLIATNPNLADSDSDGLDDGEEILVYPYSDPLSTSGPSFEVGSVIVSQANATSWTLVNLNRAFSQPVVVMGPPTKNGGQPMAIRVRNVSPTSFEFQMDEWDYLNGSHISETIGYLVVEVGTSVIGSLSVNAGIQEIGTSWKTTSFLSSFVGAPVVLAQVASEKDPSAVTDRIRNVTSASFQVRIQEEEAADGIHSNEEVHWIAIQPGTTTSGTTTILVDRTGNSVIDAFFAETFSTSVSSPVFVARAQTTDGGNTAVLRHRSLTATSVEVQVEEEQSLDSEVAHTTEDVGYVAIGG